MRDHSNSKNDLPYSGNESGQGNTKVAHTHPVKLVLDCCSPFYNIREIICCSI